MAYPYQEESNCYYNESKWLQTGACMCTRIDRNKIDRRIVNVTEFKKCLHRFVNLIYLVITEGILWGGLQVPYFYFLFSFILWYFAHSSSLKLYQAFSSIVLLTVPSNNRVINQIESSVNRNYYNQILNLDSEVDQNIYIYIYIYIYIFNNIDIYFPLRKYWIEIHSEPIRTILIHRDICIRANANHSEPIRETFCNSFDEKR